MSVTRVTALTILFIVSPALSTSTEPVSTRETESSMSVLPSLLLLGAATGITHFTRHHGKTTALFTRTRGFKFRLIQREDISLEGNTVDNADNVGNFLRTIGYLTHRFHYAIHHFAAGAGRCRRTFRVSCEAWRALSAFASLSRAAHAGGSFFQRGCACCSVRRKDWCRPAPHSSRVPA